MVECWISFYNTPILQYSTIARLKEFGQPWINLFIDSLNFFENTIGCHGLSTYFVHLNERWIDAFDFYGPHAQRPFVRNCRLNCQIQIEKIWGKGIFSLDKKKSGVVSNSVN